MTSIYTFSINADRPLLSIYVSVLWVISASVATTVLTTPWVYPSILGTVLLAYIAYRYLLRPYPCTLQYINGQWKLHPKIHLSSINHSTDANANHKMNNSIDIIPQNNTWLSERLILLSYREVNNKKRLPLIISKTAVGPEPMRQLRLLINCINRH